jgi:hypothetical protein
LKSQGLDQLEDIIVVRHQTGTRKTQQGNKSAIDATKKIKMLQPERKHLKSHYTMESQIITIESALNHAKVVAMKNQSRLHMTRFRWMLH